MELVKRKLKHDAIVQYKIEERSTVSRRLIISKNRMDSLIKIMKKDRLSPNKNLETLKNEIFLFTKDDAFKKSKSMGDLMEATFNYTRNNYEKVNLSELLSKKLY